MCATKCPVGISIFLRGPTERATQCLKLFQKLSSLPTPARDNMVHFVSSFPLRPRGVFVYFSFSGGKEKVHESGRVPVTGYTAG